MRREPFEAEHAQSMARKAAPPKNLLGWFMEQYRLEMPARIHSNDVWRDQVSPDEARNGLQAVGGSVLGSPRTNEAFRRYIEATPFITEVAEYEGHKDRIGHYSFPLRAALATLAGRGKDTDDYPFMARTLYRTALRDGDWDSACASMGIPGPVRKVYIEEALRRLWTKFSIEPPARTIRTNAA